MLADEDARGSAGNWKANIHFFQMLLRGHIVVVDLIRGFIISKTVFPLLALFARFSCTTKTKRISYAGLSQIVSFDIRWTVLADSSEDDIPFDRTFSDFVARTIRGLSGNPFQFGVISTDFRLPSHGVLVKQPPPRPESPAEMVSTEF